MIKALKEYNNEVMKPALRWTGRHWKQETLRLWQEDFLLINYFQRNNVNID